MSHKCIICQKATEWVKKATFPLHPITVDTPFQQWGLDIIGPINSPSSQQHKYILTPMNYFTIWSKSLPLRVVNMNHVISFLNSHIITRFRILECLVFDNSSYFSSLDMNVFTL